MFRARNGSLRCNSVNSLSTLQDSYFLRRTVLAGTAARSMVPRSASDIKTRATADYRHASARAYVAHGAPGVAYESGGCVGVLCTCDVQQVMRHAAHLLFGYFAGADIEPPVYLPGIRGNDLAVKTLGDLHRQSTFANRRGSDDYDDFWAHARHISLLARYCQHPHWVWICDPKTREIPRVTRVDLYASGGNGSL